MNFDLSNVKVRRNSILNKNLFFPRLFFLNFFLWFSASNSLKLARLKKWVAIRESWEPQFSNHVWHYIVSSNSFGELLLWTQPNKIFFSKFLPKLGVFFYSILIFTSIWSMLPIHVIHGWKAVYFSSILAPGCPG